MQQKIYKQKEESFPAHLQNDFDIEWEHPKEIATLLSMGIETYEIQYLLHLKKKEESRMRWENNRKK